MNNAFFPICISKCDAKLISSELVSVKPLLPPRFPAGYFYMDYKYENSIKLIRKKKLLKIVRRNKLKYIDTLLKK